MYKTIVSSPIGNITLTSDGIYLTGLYIEGQKYFLEGKKELIENNDLEIFNKTKSWLKKYFKGKNPNPKSLKIKIEGTNFRKMAWLTLLEIPYGKTISYQDLGKIVAEKLEKEKMSAQAIGGAISHNPISIIIPCHRVIGKNGSLTGYVGGLEKKRYLLQLEKAEKP